MRVYIVITCLDVCEESGMIGMAPVYADKETAQEYFPGFEYVIADLPARDDYSVTDEEYGEAVAREGEEEQQLFQALAEGDL